MSHKTFLVSSLTLCATILSSKAAIPFVLATDGSGNFISQNGTNGAVSPASSYSGNGDVQANVSTSGPNDSDLLVDNLTSGTLNIADLRKFDDFGGPTAAGSAGTSGSEITGGISTSLDISFTGGTGDLRVSNTLASNAGAKTNPNTALESGFEEYSSIGVTDLANVTEITLKFTFSQPLAAREPSTPLGAALAIINLDGVSLDDINAQVSFGGIVHDADGSGPGTTFSSGLAPGSIGRPVGPGNTDPAINTSWEDPVANSATFTIDGFHNQSLGTPTLPTDGSDPQSVGSSGGNGFHFIHGFDIPGENATNDARSTYITEQTWTISLDNGETFNENTIFTFSLDGAQHSNLAFATAAIPEPSTALLSLMGLSSFILRRQRRNKRNA